MPGASELSQGNEITITDKLILVQKLGIQIKLLFVTHIFQELFENPV